MLGLKQATTLRLGEHVLGAQQGELCLLAGAKCMGCKPEEGPSDIQVSNKQVLERGSEHPRGTPGEAVPPHERAAAS